MKNLTWIGMLLLISVAAYPQTTTTMDLGHGAFSTEDCKIMMVIDASLADLKMDKPYVMFMAWMMGKSYKEIEIGRDDVVLLYKGQEYKMASYEEFQNNHQSLDFDMRIFRHLPNMALRYSILKYYMFSSCHDFFPRLGVSKTDKGFLDDRVGFRTKLCFKNPGFNKGDELVFKVKDKNNPDINGEIVVVLQ